MQYVMALTCDDERGSARDDARDELAEMKGSRRRSSIDPVFGERPGYPGTIAIAPDGKTFALAGDGIVRLYEVPK